MYFIHLYLKFNHKKLSYLDSPLSLVLVLILVLPVLRLNLDLEDLLEFLLDIDAFRINFFLSPIMKSHSKLSPYLLQLLIHRRYPSLPKNSLRKKLTSDNSSLEP